MKLSVCVPVHDAAPYVGRCARSLFSQTMREDIEFIFVDDGSKDASVAEIEDALSGFPERAKGVKIVRLPECTGIGAARNRAMEVAEGRHVAHCDADDWVDASMYERMLAAMEDSGADVAYCGMMVEVRDGTWRRQRAPSHATARELVAAEMPSQVFNSPCNKIYTRALVEKSRARFPEGVPVGSDLLFNADILRAAGKVARCDCEPYHYCRNLQSISHRRAVSDGRAIIGLADRIASLYPGQDVSAARDRLFRNALLAGLRYGLLSPREYRAMRGQMTGAAWDDPRYGILKKALLAVADWSPAFARSLVSLLGPFG